MRVIAGRHRRPATKPTQRKACPAAKNPLFPEKNRVPVRHDRYSRPGCVESGISDDLGIGTGPVGVRDGTAVSSAVCGRDPAPTLTINSRGRTGIDRVARGFDCVSWLVGRPRKKSTVLQLPKLSLLWLLN
jgi:hypothetical protein